VVGDAHTRGRDNGEAECFADARKAMATDDLAQRLVAPVPVIKYHPLPRLMWHQGNLRHHLLFYYQMRDKTISPHRRTKGVDMIEDTIANIVYQNRGGM
jgi:hypothetical protein